MPVSEISKITAPIENELNLFEKKFKQSMKSEVALLDKITHYIIKRKGKQMRPMFVFLSANINGGNTEATYTAASLIELLHTATLVHDDVVDDAYERRGFFSLNALWKNKIAVLVGDYLLSRGLILSVEHGQFKILEIVSRAVREMSEGELLQIEKARRLDITEAVYFDIIRQKTASLIASCCASGAASAGCSPEQAEHMWTFGEKVGIAFQIKDDIFDYGSSDKIGKPTGIDIKERKLTLPLIYALNHTDKRQNNRIRNIIKNKNEDPEKVKEVIDFVINSGGIKYAEEVMNQYTQEGLAMLEDFPESASKDSLIALVNYTINRTK